MRQDETQAKISLVKFRLVTRNRHPPVQEGGSTKAGRAGGHDRRRFDAGQQKTGQRPVL